jgi:hypothetical protein
MSQPQLLICERTGRWAIAWRGALGAEARVQEVRSLKQVDEILQPTPSVPVAVDGAAFSSEKLLQAIARWSAAGATVLVMAPQDWVGEESTFREVGATHVVFSPRSLRPAVRLVERHYRGLPDEPAEVGTVEERIRRRLPWARWAKASP